MGSKINRLPTGLQDILGNVASGENPSNLGDFVQPYFNILPLWLTDRIELKTASFAAAVVGDSAIVEVPVGQLWIPINISGRFTATAIGDDMMASLLIQKNAGLSSGSLEQSNRLVSASTLELIRFGTQFNQLVAIPSGYRFHCIADVLNIAAGTRNIQIEMLVYEINV